MYQRVFAVMCTAVFLASLHASTVAQTAPAVGPSMSPAQHEAAGCGTGVVTAVTPVGAECVDFTPAQGGGPDNYEVQEGGTYMMTISGVTECAGGTITVFVQSSASGNFCFNAFGGGGEYTGVFTVPDPTCHTMPVSYKCGADAACNNPGSISAQGPTSGCGGVHLRSANFDGMCNLTGTDEDCSDDCEAATSVQLGAPCPALLTITPPVQGAMSTATYDGDTPGGLAFFFYSSPGVPFMLNGCEIFLDLPATLGTFIVLDGDGDGQVTVSNGDHPCAQGLVVQAFTVDMNGFAEASNGVLLTFGN